MNDLCLGIDLGGTKVLGILIDKDNNIIGRAKVKTKYKLGPEEICIQIKELANSVLSETQFGLADVKDIGVAVPTSIDPKSGDSLHSPALGWRNLPIKKTLENVFGREIHLENDANCGIYSEFKLGAGKGFDNVVGYFVGTGLGGGIIVNGRLIRGIRGAAAELGHEIIKFNGRKCGCGNRGCLEAYCSKTAFGKRFQKEIMGKNRKSIVSKYAGDDFTRLKSSVLADAFRHKDELTVKIVTKGFEALGVAVANIAAVLAPECVVIGGGVVQSLGEAILPFVQKGFENNLFALSPNDIKIRLSELGDDAVPLGAALNARAGGHC